MKKYIFVVKEHDEGERSDRYLYRSIEEYPRGFIRKNLDKRNLLINGIVGKPSSILKALDRLEFTIDEIGDTKAIPENIPINILYEDDDIIVVNKPQGMVVHPSPGHLSGTLFNALLYYIKEKAPESAKDVKIGIVHRIDKDTSGIVVISKNNEAHNYLSKQFVSHTITRKYHAIVLNDIEYDTGKIDKPIAREKEEHIKRIVDYTNGKNAITYYKVLKRFGNFTYVECTIDTGRTHQIRVHMAHINNPLLGDELYGGAVEQYKLQGQVLHAKVLGFIHPRTNDYIEFEVKVPEYFKKLLVEFTENFHGKK